MLLGGVYLCWVPQYFERQKLREKYKLKPNPSCGDCLTTGLCSACAVCQEAREIESRGNSWIIVFTLFFYFAWLENVKRVDFKVNGDRPVVLQPTASPVPANAVNVRI